MVTSGIAGMINPFASGIAPKNLLFPTGHEPVLQLNRQRSGYTTRGMSEIGSVKWVAKSRINRA